MNSGTSNLVPQEPPSATITLVAAGTAWNRRIRQCFGKCPDIALTRGIGTLDQLLSKYERQTPFVLLADYDYVAHLDKPEEFGKRIHFGRSVQVLVLVAEERSAVLDKLLQAGCMGYLQQKTSPSALRKAVRAVASGEIWAPRRSLTRLLHSYLEDKKRHKLTKRESELLKLVAEGQTNRQMAEALNITHDTVRWHLRMLYGKLGVHSRKAASELDVDGD